MIDNTETRKDVLECRKCQRLVHFACSELPLYQIQVCFAFKLRSYQCRNCIQITQELMQVVESTKQNTKKQPGTHNEEITNISAEQIPKKEKSKENIERSIEDRLDKIEKKIEDLVTQSTKQEESDKPKQSYAVAAKNHKEEQSKESKRIMTRENEEERWIQSTKCNIILHGLIETTQQPKEEALAEDEEFFRKDVLQQIGVDIKVASFERIGVLTEENERKEKYRPLRIRLETENEKIKILKSLHKFWNPFISITEDLTRRERELIKEWRRKADAKNANLKDELYQWRVRGSPRGRLYLKKVFAKDK